MNNNRPPGKEQGKIGFVSLGCPKALVDSEHIITRLRAEGYRISPSYEDADLVVINTCGFINDAVDESLETIAEALHENGRVIVTGCLGGRGELVRQQYPAVLAVTGPHATDEVISAVHRHCPPDSSPYTSLVPPHGIKLTPKHYAYLKISEGCNHHCTFCIIPSLRGKLVSRPVGDVMQEAQNLVDAGVRELLVISQDTSAYGVDVGYRTGFWQGRPIKTRFVDLARALGELGVWVRMHYVYPYPHVDDVVPLMAEGRILPYLDIPFQHASPAILKAMKRPAHSENILSRIRHWRSLCPDIALRSTFIVGFPGETDDDFKRLLEFLREARLDRVGCFQYSAVDGAAANDLPGHVDEEIKQQRFEELMAVQAGISEAKLAHRIAQRMTVLVDQVDDGQVIARSYADAPDIDGLVYIDIPAQQGSPVMPGDWLEVTITGSDEHDLFATVRE